MHRLAKHYEKWEKVEKRLLYALIATVSHKNAETRNHLDEKSRFFRTKFGL